MIPIYNKETVGSLVLSSQESSVVVIDFGGKGWYCLHLFHFFDLPKKFHPTLFLLNKSALNIYIYIYIYRKERECVMFKSQTWIYHIHSFIFFPSKMMHLIIKEITIQAKRDLSVLYMCSVCMRKDSYCGCWICINNLVARHLGAFNMCTVGMRKDSL